MTTKELSIDDIRERIISTEKVAHVTFYIVKETVKGEDYYFVYSESKKLGLRLIGQSFEYQQNDTGSYEDALIILRGEIQRLEEILERKRAGFPTQKQMYFLFCEKIPIPIDLTWGQASDLIDERLSQITKEKQQAQLDRFKGFQVGMRVTYSFFTCSAKVGEITTRTQHTKTGTISKLTTNNKGIIYAYITFDGENYKSRVSTSYLKKVDEKQDDRQARFEHGESGGK